MEVLKISKNGKHYRNSCTIGYLQVNNFDDELISAYDSQDIHRNTIHS